MTPVVLSKRNLDDLFTPWTPSTGNLTILHANP
jgi:hypothetical protein